MRGETLVERENGAVDTLNGTSILVRDNVDDIDDAMREVRGSDRCDELVPLDGGVVIGNCEGRSDG